MREGVPGVPIATETLDGAPDAGESGEETEEA